MKGRRPPAIRRSKRYHGGAGARERGFAFVASVRSGGQGEGHPQVGVAAQGRQGFLAPLDEEQRPLAPPLAKPEAARLVEERGTQQTVEVRVHEEPAGRLDFADEREGGAGDGAPGAEAVGDGPGEEGLAGAEVPREEDEIPRLERPGDGLPELAGRAARRELQVVSGSASSSSPSCFLGASGSASPRRRRMLAASPRLMARRGFLRASSHDRA